MESSSLDLIKALIEALAPALQLGPLSVLGTCVLFSLRILKHFAPGVWDRLPGAAKVALPFGVAALGTFLGALGPLGVVAALGSALVAGLGAIGLHIGTKAVGKKVTLEVPLTPLRELGLKLMLDKRPPSNVIPLRR